MASPNQLSFLPDDYLERKARRRTNLVLAVLFLIAAGGIGTMYSFTSNALAEARRVHDGVSKDHTSAALQIQQFQQLQEKQRTMNHQAELAASLLEKVPRTRLLAEFTDACAKTEVSLLDLVLDSRLRSGGAAGPQSAFERKKAEARAKKGEAPITEAPQAKNYDVTIKLSGIADTDIQVAQFIALLNQSTMLREVNLVMSEEYKQGDEVLRRFQLEMMVNPEIKHLAPAKVETKTAAVELQ